MLGTHGLARWIVTPLEYAGNMAIKDTLKALMEQRGISQNELGEKTKVPQPTIFRILSGESKDPRHSTVKPIADFFGVTVAQLRGDDPMCVSDQGRKYSELESNHMTERDVDFCGWVTEQVELLRAGRIAEADIESLVDEIESLGKSERRELDNRLRELMMYLIKWHWQPESRGNGWLVSISKQRDGIRDVLDDSPSINSKLADAACKAWPLAMRYAALETGIDVRVFPSECPWGLDDVLNEQWLPE